MPKVPINEVLAARLKAARDALGVSQAELGVRMGLPDEVASTRINRYERAKHAPDIETAERMAAALGIPLPALLCRDDKLAEVIAGFALLSGAQQDSVLAQVQNALGAKRSKSVKAKLERTTPPAKGVKKPSDQRL